MFSFQEGGRFHLMVSTHQEENVLLFIPDVFQFLCFISFETNQQLPRFPSFNHLKCLLVSLSLLPLMRVKEFPSTVFTVTLPSSLFLRMSETLLPSLLSELTSLHRTSFILLIFSGLFISYQLHLSRIFTIPPSCMFTLSYPYFSKVTFPLSGS